MHRRLPLYITVPGVTNEHVMVPDKPITMALPTCIQTIEPTPTDKSPLVPAMRFCWVIIMTSLWETVAYLFRTVNARHENIAVVYTVYGVFILVSPLLFVGQNRDMPGFFGACVALVRRRMGQKELTQSSEKDEAFMKDVRENYVYKSGA
ncbi:hypothetical protein DL767_009156 [Monosporascus sp. MG133]|nr:hypothetical protein DL767_009156 [Monosporascus sp. MG133]